MTRKRVAVDKTKKLIALLIDPYQVVEKMGSVSYKVKDLLFNRRGRHTMYFRLGVDVHHTEALARMTEREYRQWLRGVGAWGQVYEPIT